MHVQNSYFFVEGLRERNCGILTKTVDKETGKTAGLEQSPLTCQKTEQHILWPSTSSCHHPFKGFVRTALGYCSSVIWSVEIKKPTKRKKNQLQTKIPKTKLYGAKSLSKKRK